MRRPFSIVLGVLTLGCSGLFALNRNGGTPLHGLYSLPSVRFAVTPNSPTRATDSDLVALVETKEDFSKITKVDVFERQNGRAIVMGEKWHNHRKVLTDVDSYLDFLTIENGKMSSKLFRVMGLNKNSGEDGPREAFAPQFSPDGKYLLFKFGNPYSDEGRFRLYVIDLSNFALQLVSPKYLTCQWTSWSPDSNDIAFVQGGDSEGMVTDIGGYIGPLVLTLCDWKLGDEHEVKSSDSIRGPFAWLIPHTLLYEDLTPSDEKTLAKHQSATTYIEPRPSTYSYSIENNESQLLIKDGHSPVVTVDGSRLAFLGLEDLGALDRPQTGTQFLSRSYGLCVSKLNGSERIALGREGDDYDIVGWLDGGQHLITLRETPVGLKESAEVQKWDIATGKSELIANLKLNVSAGSPRSVLEPFFDIARFDTGKGQLFVKVCEYNGMNKATGLLNLSCSINAINIKTRTIKAVLKVDGTFDVDWFSDS